MQFTRQTSLLEFSVVLLINTIGVFTRKNLLIVNKTLYIAELRFNYLLKLFIKVFRLLSLHVKGVTNQSNCNASDKTWVVFVFHGIWTSEFSLLCKKRPYNLLKLLKIISSLVEQEIFFLFGSNGRSLIRILWTQQP